jgi:hypothetical protein
MKPPLTNLEGARIVRATHTTGQDSLRLEFERDILLMLQRCTARFSSLLDR